MKTEKVKDPVCGMEFDKKDAAAKSQKDGKDQYFCSNECKNEYEKKPEK